MKVGATDIEICFRLVFGCESGQRGFRSKGLKKGRLLETSSLIASTVQVGEGNPNLYGEKQPHGLPGHFSFICREFYTPDHFSGVIGILKN